MFEQNRKLEEINIGGNLFNDEDLSHIKNYVGKVKMTQEELDIHNKKVKDKDFIIEKNKKLKIQKKPEEPVPILEEVALIGDTYYVIKNTILKNLNLIQNHFTENCFGSVVHMLEVTQELNIIIDGNIFSKQIKDSSNDTYDKYSHRIYLLKF